mmetsp:Transcript_50011/g.113638  ORF Transcript_50011/g.113638 Transcript_50011/m.113638 type:complete len:218 (+) Transcript_50011:1273-1926(+)
MVPAPQNGSNTTVPADTPAARSMAAATVVFTETPRENRYALFDKDSLLINLDTITVRSTISARITMSGFFISAFTRYRSKTAPPTSLSTSDGCMCPDSSQVTRNDFAVSNSGMDHSEVLDRCSYIARGASSATGTGKVYRTSNASCTHLRDGSSYGATSCTRSSPLPRFDTSADNAAASSAAINSSPGFVVSRISSMAAAAQSCCVAGMHSHEVAHT